MIVCHCRVVSDRTIRSEIEAGADSVCAVARRCGAGTGNGCGACRPTIAALVAVHAPASPVDPASEPALPAA
ncbi:MAG TPA: (2Fe-2S)-binding protein [Acidimicrobiales bacterium]|jgi:bacterioferritin-associated ferredoxin|nr:(2Fe-2S)-binding protein [Acidimicrobiales bacterium]